MKTKSILSFALASLFLVVLFASLSSAVVLNSVPSTLKQDSSSFTFNATGSSDVSETVTFKIADIVDGSSKIEFSISPSTISLTNSSNEKITVTYSTADFNFRFLDSYSLTLNAESNNSANVSKSIKFEDTDYCVYDLSSNLRLTIDSIEVISGLGDRDKYYFPMDEVEVEIEYRYRGSNRNDEFVDGEIEWALYASNGKRIATDSFDIDDLEYGDDGEETFTIFLDADDLIKDEKEYTLYVRLTGKEDYDDGGVERICISASKQISLTIDRNLVIVTDVNFPSEVAPGEEFILTGNVWNIGSRDQEDLYLIISSSQLGIDEKISFSEIKYFNKKSFSIPITVPSNAQEKSYSFNIEVYDSKNKVYQSSEKDDSSFNYFLNVKGTSYSSSKVLINAYLQGEAIEGNEAKVKATVTNLGTSSQTYIVKIEDYSSWASLKSGSSQILIINGGASKEIELIFDLNKKTSGEKTFTIDVYSVDNNLIETQPVQISIKSKSGFSGLFDSWYIWLIAGLNIILVLVIILVVIKILRR